MDQRRDDRMQRWRQLLCQPGIQRLVKLVKFGSIGVLNTAVDFGVYSLLLYIGVDIYLSQVVSYITATLNSYLINRKWTFHTKSRILSPALVKFLLVNLTMMLLNMLGIHIGVTYFFLHPVLAKAASACVVLVLNFLLSNFWVFGAKGSAKAPDKGQSAG